MVKCPVCSSDSLVKNASVYGPEVFCNGCRRIIISAALGFKFLASEQPVECKLPDGRPGLKGPGEKAVCHPYSNDDEKKKAYELAMASVYSFEHRRAASKLVSGLAYFTGLPAYAQADPTASQDLSDQADNPPTVVPEQPLGVTSFNPAAGSPIADVTTDEGHQENSDLNGGGTPLNSGTNASRRFAELIEEELGPAFCTEHMAYDRCNLEQNPLQSLRKERFHYELRKY